MVLIFHAMPTKFRVFATCDIGEAINLLRNRGYDVEVYPRPEAPPKSLIIEKVKSGIDGLITTLRDPIDAEVFEAGKGTLKGVAQIAVGFDNINRTDANRYKIPFTHTADVLTEATAEFAFFIMGTLARKMWTAEHLTPVRREPGQVLGVAVRVRERVVELRVSQGRCHPILKELVHLLRCASYERARFQ